MKVPRVTREEVLAHPTFLRLRATRPGQLATSLYEINLRDRALTLAGQAFIALVPLLILLATAASGSDGVALADYLIDKFHLTGGSADAVTLLFERPPDSRSGLSLIGLVILLVSFSSFARSMQRTYEVAWEPPCTWLPTQPARGRRLRVPARHLRAPRDDHGPGGLPARRPAPGAGRRPGVLDPGVDADLRGSCSVPGSPGAGWHPGRW